MSILRFKRCSGQFYAEAELINRYKWPSLKSVFTLNRPFSLQHAFNDALAKGRF